MTAARKPRRLVIKRSNTLQLGAPTRQPLRAALLTIDAARKSGCALYVAGALRSYDEVDAESPTARDRIVREAVTAAEVRGMPLGLVIETPWGGHQSAALALTATVRLWRDSWRRAGQSDAQLIEVTVGEWRRALFGRRALSRTAARELEAQVAHTAARRDLPRVRHYTIGPDACAAICIGQVMARSSGVQAVLRCELVS